MTTVSITSAPISATATQAGVSVSVSSSTSSILTSGGAGPVGPVGPMGPQGPAVGSLADMDDVHIDSAAAGDLLRYSDGKWRDYPESGIEIDGSNF